MAPVSRHYLGQPCNLHGSLVIMGAGGKLAFWGLVHKGKFRTSAGASTRNPEKKQEIGKKCSLSRSQAEVIWWSLSSSSVPHAIGSAVVRTQPRAQGRLHRQVGGGDRGRTPAQPACRRWPTRRRAATAQAHPRRPPRWQPNPGAAPGRSPAGSPRRSLRTCGRAAPVGISRGWMWPCSNSVWLPRTRQEASRILSNAWRQRLSPFIVSVITLYIIC